MLDSKDRENFLPPEIVPIAADEPSAAELIARALGVVRRQIFVVLVLALLGAVFGWIFFVHAPQTFTAKATLLINTRKIEIFQHPAVSDELPMQAVGAVESQVQLLRSDEVALRVIRKLNLSEDPRFIQGKSFVGQLLFNIVYGYHTESPTLSEDERQNLALKPFHQNLTVNRLGVTYAIEIEFQSRYPDLAAEVANALADAYVDLQRTSEYDAARRASDWLEGRIPELRVKSQAAQKAVVKYKQDHNIVETGNGQLIDDQRLDDMTPRLNAARDETLKAKARSDQLAATSGIGFSSSVAGGSDLNGAGSDLLDKLRVRYSDLAFKEAEFSAKWGRNNPAIISLRNQKAELRSEIAEEIQRVKKISESDYAAAQLREATLKKEFDVAVARSREGKEAEVKLRELEASARAYQDLYNTYLNRDNASLQQAASPVAEATIITPATPLIQRDYKKTIQVAALFPLAGIMLGFGVALLREVLSGRVFLTSNSIQSRLRIACVGLLPKVQQGKRVRWWARQAQSGPNQADGLHGYSQLLAAIAASRTLLRGDRGISWRVVDHPFSRFSEGVRSVKLAIDLENRSRSTRVVGVTSASPNEGKSTVALAVAQLIANNGASVVLVDCDLRNPSLTRSVAPNAASGIVELAFGRASLEDVVWKDQSTQMAFLAAIPNAGPPDPPSVLSSAQLSRVFDELRKQYQFVIVDLSPLTPVIDVCATTELVDAYVLVIEWGRTTVDVVQRALRAVPLVSELILGAVLNKADIKVLTSYDPYVTSYYFDKGDRR
jgi:polysaccharide biosynthesis transport protein